MCVSRRPRASRYFKPNYHFTQSCFDICEIWASLTFGVLLIRYEGTSWILEILDWFQKVFHLLSMANAPNSFQNFKNASGMTHFNRSGCFEYALIWMLRNCDIYNSGGIVKKEL